MIAIVNSAIVWGYQSNVIVQHCQKVEIVRGHNRERGKYLRGYQFDVSWTGTSSGRRQVLYAESGDQAMDHWVDTGLTMLPCA